MLPNSQPKIINQKSKIINSRGAPRGNTNALTHGAWSSRRLTPLSTLACTLASLRQQFNPFPAAPAPGLIEKTQVVLSQIFDQVDFEQSLEISLHATTQLSGTISFLGRLRSRQFHLNQDQRDLETVAPHALDIIRVDFRDHAITRDADLQRGNVQTCKHANDPRPSIFDVQHLLPMINGPSSNQCSPPQMDALPIWGRAGGGVVAAIPPTLAVSSMQSS